MLLSSGAAERSPSERARLLLRDLAACQNHTGFVPSFAFKYGHCGDVGNTHETEEGVSEVCCGNTDQVEGGCCVETDQVEGGCCGDTDQVEGGCCGNTDQEEGGCCDVSDEEAEAECGQAEQKMCNMCGKMEPPMADAVCKAAAQDNLQEEEEKENSEDYVPEEVRVLLASDSKL